MGMMIYGLVHVPSVLHLEVKPLGKCLIIPLLGSCLLFCIYSLCLCGFLLRFSSFLSQKCLVMD